LAFRQHEIRKQALLDLHGLVRRKARLIEHDRILNLSYLDRTEDLLACSHKTGM
jgi:hypothetical protein